MKLNIPTAQEAAQIVSNMARARIEKYASDAEQTILTAIDAGLRSASLPAPIPYAVCEALLSTGYNVTERDSGPNEREVTVEW